MYEFMKSYKEYEARTGKRVFNIWKSFNKHFCAYSEIFLFIKKLLLLRSISYLFGRVKMKMMLQSEFAISRSK